MICARRFPPSPRSSPASALYLDYTGENIYRSSWAVGAFYVEHGKHTFMRFYDFLEFGPGACSGSASAGRRARSQIWS